MKIVEEEGLLDEYECPYCSNVEASCVFNDTITINHFEEGKQPDGTYLITYVYKYIEEYKIALHVRVLTSGLKRKLKYHSYAEGTELKIKGDLDMYVTGPSVFTQADGSIKSAVIAVAVTIIDIL